MIGPKLAHYDITSHLGTGGMGEVYQATDSKLGRKVAIKLLPAAFGSDADRLSRFRREAQVLASLNHPNIAQIYGLEESGEAPCIVMELVEGETLQSRIKKGPIPVDEALTIAKQIAEALEAAHEKGIIHRDLKPGNVMLTADGKVKVLDFGLAKAYDTNPSSLSLSNSPTMASMAATNAGVILGTAAYMSPEQTKGRSVDKRADIFAFGCVLYEMLTGFRAFDGEDVIEILGRVVTAEPDLTRLPDATPPAIRRLLKRAFKKDPRQRLSDIHDARIEIEEAYTQESTSSSVIAGPQSSANRRPVIWIAATVVLLLIAASLGGLLLQIVRSKPEPSITRFFIAAPDHLVLAQSYNGPLISPDGKRVAFVTRAATGKSQLWVRSLDNLAAQLLPGTDGAYSPFWSPDSRSIAFFAQTKLKRIDVAGGAAQNLCDAASGRGGAWNSEGVILFSSSTGPLLRVTAGGGQPAAATMLSAGQTNHRGPSFLPDGKHYLYYSLGTPETKGIYISSLDDGASRRLFDADTNAIYSSGQLLFVQNSALMRRAYDAATLQITGDPAPVVDFVGTDGSNIAAVSVSENGTLVYRNGAGLSESRQLGKFDRTGKLIDRVGPPGRYIGLDLSPDGKRLAVHRHDDNGGDIWLIELLRGAMSRFTFDAAQDNSMPIWSPDGTNIVFSSVRKGKWGLYQKPANGSGKEQLLYESATGDAAPMSWSADGKYIVFQVTGARTGWDLWVLPLTGDRKAYPMMDSPSNETWAEVSPDSKWIVYNSDETGRYEIYIRPFPMGEGKWQVSTNGGWYPRWRRQDGKELFFADAAANGKLLSVRINISGSTPEFSPATPLFDSGYININHGVHHKYAVSSDGQHFIIPRPESAVSGESSDLLPPPITVVLNWASTLNKK